MIVYGLLEVYSGLPLGRSTGWRDSVRRHPPPISVIPTNESHARLHITGSINDLDLSQLLQLRPEFSPADPTLSRLWTASRAQYGGYSRQCPWIQSVVRSLPHTSLGTRGMTSGTVSPSWSSNSFSLK